MVILTLIILRLLIIKLYIKQISKSSIRQLYYRTKSMSEWIKIKHGVPQGSVLSPLLFLLYINDLPKVLSNNALPILFADDTGIIITGNNELTYQEELNATFTVITNWFQLNALFLNFDKTQFVQFTSNNLNNYDTHVYYEDNYIAKVNDIKIFRDKY